MKNPLNRSLLLLVGLIAVAPAASASTLRSIVLDNASISGTWALTDSGYTYPESGIDHYNVVAPWLSSWTPSGTGKSIKFEHSPTTQIKQRTEYSPMTNIPFYNTRYYGYRLAAIATSADITGWTVITQFQQLGTANSPFVGIELSSSTTPGKISIMVGVMNEDYNNIGGELGPLGHSVRFGPFDITPNQWYKVNMAIQPNPSGNGRVALWINDVKVLDETMKVGFPESYTTTNGVTYPFELAYRNKFGLYRKGQSSTVKVYFDNYNITDYYGDLLP